MVITKSAASKIAVKLAEKKKVLMDEALLAYRKFVTDKYMEQVPKEVIKLNAVHPDYFATGSTIRFDGHGFRWAYIEAPRRVIYGANREANLNLDAKLAAEITKFKMKFESKKKEYESLVNKLEVALVGLKTYKRIAVDLPEAVKYLPAKQTTELAINFVDLRKELK